MMDIRKDYTAAYIDGEITDEIIRNEVKNRIESDKDFAIDYKVQLLVKSLITERISHRTAPNKVRAKILKSIGSDTKVINPSRSLFSNIFENPAFSFATALVVVFAVALIIMNRGGLIEKREFALGQLGEKNMFVQAQNNFNSILQGKLTPQLTTSESQEITRFFQEKGVKYATIVPDISDWNILGAVVSEDSGEKFAHHVYVGENGELAYLFQVDESYLYSHKIITLTDDLIRYLDEGNCYTTTKEGAVTLLKKMGNNICAVVSNGNPETVEKTFCSL